MVHTITGNFIEPRVFGETMDLHPIVVLLSLMLWGSLWGVVGMCLAVPISAVIKICLQSLDHPLPRYLAGVFEGHIEMTDPAVISGSTPTGASSAKSFCLSPSGVGGVGSGSSSGGSSSAGAGGVGGGAGGGGVGEICLIMETRDEAREAGDGDPLLPPALPQAEQAAV